MEENNKAFDDRFEKPPDPVDFSTETFFERSRLQRRLELERRVRKRKYDAQKSKEQLAYILTGRRKDEPNYDPGFFHIKPVAGFILCAIATLVSMNLMFGGPDRYYNIMSAIMGGNGGKEFGGYAFIVILFFTYATCLISMMTLALIELQAREDSAMENGVAINKAADHEPAYGLARIAMAILFVNFLLVSGMASVFSVNYVVLMIGLIVGGIFTMKLRKRLKVSERYNRALEKAPS